MSIKPGLFTIAAAVLVVGLSACGTSAGTSGSPAAATASHMSSPPMSTATGPSAGPAGPQSVLITISNFKYSVPASVAPGAKVTVKNQDSQSHTLTSSMNGAFDVRVDADGGTATFMAPAKPGSYPFSCMFHANMMGTLMVK